MKEITSPIIFASTRISALALALAMTSCGGVGQDTGTPVSLSAGQTFYGRAIDGYLARASVYLDTNNNGTRDSWEPFAFTDDDGYFSYNPETQTDYCADDASEEQRQYCLHSASYRSSTVIRVERGYDVYTGEPFVGQLSRRLSNIASDSSSVDTSVVSPLTTLLTHAESDQQRDQLTQSLGLQTTDLDVDYFNVAGSGVTDNRLLNTALKVHKTVTVLADRLTDQYTEIGEEFGTPNDATSTIYQNLARSIITTNSAFHEVLDDSEQVRSIVRQSEDKIRNVYEQRDLDLPSYMADSAIDRVSHVSRSISRIVDNFVAADSGVSTDHKRMRGLTRSIETVVIKALDEVGTDSSLNNAIEFLTNGDNTDLLASLVDSLSEDDADVSGLAGHSFAPQSLQSADDIANASRIGPAAEQFSSIAGNQIRISDLNLGSAPYNLRDLELEMYFTGNEGATQGAFTACGKFIEDAHSDGTLGEGNTHGELLKGRWSLLNPTTDNRSYNILLTVEFLGAKYSALMKSVGPTTVGAQTYKQIRFDHDGEYRIWHSEHGLVETESVPATHTECENRLPSRVGL